MFQGQLPTGVAWPLMWWTVLLLEALHFMVSHAANLNKAQEPQKGKLAAHGTRSVGRSDRIRISQLEYEANLTSAVADARNASIAMRDQLRESYHSLCGSTSMANSFISFVLAMFTPACQLF